jgi:hypothetical protein
MIVLFCSVLIIKKIDFINMDIKDPNYRNNKSSNNRKFKHIVVANEIYEQLRNHGKIGDSFNDVVKRLLGREPKTTAAEHLQNQGEQQ